MTCPKCEDGTIKKLSFKNIPKTAYICDSCNSMWFENEKIDFNTGQLFSSISGDEDLEYSINELSEKDFNSKSVMYPNLG